MLQIDINCDMGEGAGHDEDIMGLISSCNIACGGHAGSKESIANTINLATENKVSIGAHPSYPDKENFGRKAINISATALRLTLIDQLRFILEQAKIQQAIIQHIKPHGALYNDLKKDKQKAEVVVDVIKEMNPLLTLVAPPRSAVKEIAQENGLNVKTEGFADRAYEDDFSLRPRLRPGAVLTDKKAILKQVMDMVLENKIDLGEGKVLKQKFDTICIHSDTKNSLTILRYLNAQLRLKNIAIQS